MKKYKRLSEEKTYGLELKEGDTSFIFDVKRWFQKAYGNTYHSVKIYVTSGEGDKYKQTLIAEEPFNYGYGEQYLTTAAVLLGVEDRALRDDIRKHKNSKYVIRVKDVTRKKDL